MSPTMAIASNRVDFPLPFGPTKTWKPPSSTSTSRSDRYPLTCKRSRGPERSLVFKSPILVILPSGVLFTFSRTVAPNAKTRIAWRVRRTPGSLRNSAGHGTRSRLGRSGWQGECQRARVAARRMTNSTAQTTIRASWGESQLRARNAQLVFPPPCAPQPIRHRRPATEPIALTCCVE